MRVYVDNQNVFDVSCPLNNSINFQKVFSSGTHYLVDIAWNKAGTSIKREESFTAK